MLNLQLDPPALSRTLCSGGADLSEQESQGSLCAQEQPLSDSPCPWYRGGQAGNRARSWKAASCCAVGFFVWVFRHCLSSRGADEQGRLFLSQQSGGLLSTSSSLPRLCCEGGSPLCTLPLQQTLFKAVLTEIGGVNYEHWSCNSMYSHFSSPAAMPESPARHRVPGTGSLPCLPRVKRKGAPRSQA